MARITISLPDDVAQRVAREARRTGASVSELIREVLSTELGKRRRRLRIVGLGKSGTRHTARNAEAALPEGFGADRRR